MELGNELKAALAHGDRRIAIGSQVISHASGTEGLVGWAT